MHFLIPSRVTSPIQELQKLVGAACQSSPQTTEARHQGLHVGSCCTLIVHLLHPQDSFAAPSGFLTQVAASARTRGLMSALAAPWVRIHLLHPQDSFAAPSGFLTQGTLKMILLCANDPTRKLAVEPQRRSSPRHTGNS